MEKKEPRQWHPGLLYLMQFISDHLPALPPSSRVLTEMECKRAIEAVQDELDAKAAAE